MRCTRSSARAEDDDREIWMYAGERRLVNRLVLRLKKENERRRILREKS